MDQTSGIASVGYHDRAPHQALELAAGEALSARDLDKAFALADRRCRTAPPPEAHAYVLRAEANWQLGDRDAALSDLGRALGIAPDDLATNRRLMAWGNPAEQRRAAATLISVDTDTPSLRRAMDLMRDEGVRNFASVTVLDDAVRGWAVWQRGDRINLAIDGDPERVSMALDPDPFHPLAGPDSHAAGFRVPRPRSILPQTVTLRDDSGFLFSALAQPNAVRPPASASASEVADAAGVVVIVPVYADFAATKRCLDLLVDELRRNPHHRAIIINDAAPDPHMAPYLDSIARAPSLTVLTNPLNLGFVAATNRGLAEAGGCDVLLLNADTIPPPDFIDRLARTARSAADIGMVVPFSNNAELTSFPLTNADNPLAEPADAIRLDAIAAEANANTRFDIPAGTGFCLYVRHACLAATGGLLDGFHRGYLEDIDFCLRAREHGFRTVCDPSVYVGHAGSRSFGAEKASLVVRNFRILQQRFPDYPRECEAWGAADPLRPARAAIECALVAGERSARLVVAGHGPIGAIAHERARRLVEAGERVIVADVAADGRRAALRGIGGILPQSLRLDFDSGGIVDRQDDPLALLNLSGIEILDPANLPDPLLARLLSATAPIELLISGVDPLPPHTAEQRRWRRVADAADRILAPSDQAFEFASRRLDPRHAAKLVTLAGADIPRSRSPPASKLGIVTLLQSPSELRLIAAIAMRFGKAAGDALVVLGGTLEDDRIMRSDGIFVTGPVDAADDLALLSERHGVKSILAGYGRPLFGHPLVAAAARLGLPMATIDWSGGRCTPPAGDLLLDPGASPRDVADALAEWLSLP